MAIQPPLDDRSVLRASLEALAQFHPVSAALSRLYQTTHPSQFEQRVIAWRVEITDAANDLEERVAQLERDFQPSLNLSPLGVDLATWLVKTSPKGLTEGVDFEAIQTAFLNAKARDLQDAAAELKLLGLAEISTDMEHPVRQVTPRYELFWLFDPVVLGTSPQDDAVEIARFALKDDGCHVPELETAMGWDKRRLNPALALVVDLIGEGRVRQVIQADYVTLGFSMSPEERVALRRLVAAARRPPDV
ncbi:MAG: hypothetical protein JWP35_4206 [Caulobacter sp.]|nr:hypothetical protein [Caulobacter sp.]